MATALLGAAAIPAWRRLWPGGDAVGDSADGAPAQQRFIPPRDRIRLRVGLEARATAGTGSEVIPIEDSSNLAQPGGQVSAEDRHLNAEILQPQPGYAAPLAPPRASSDPEPRAADDPHDFDVRR